MHVVGLLLLHEEGCVCFAQAMHWIIAGLAQHPDAAGNGEATSSCSCRQLHSQMCSPEHDSTTHRASADLQSSLATQSFLARCQKEGAAAA